MSVTSKMSRTSTSSIDA